jgi:hypothetical protein
MISAPNGFKISRKSITDICHIRTVPDVKINAVETRSAAIKRSQDLYSYDNDHDHDEDVENQDDEEFYEEEYFSSQQPNKQRRMTNFEPEFDRFIMIMRNPTRHHLKEKKIY